MATPATRRGTPQWHSYKYCPHITETISPNPFVPPFFLIILTNWKQEASTTRPTIQYTSYEIEDKYYNSEYSASYRNPL
jgi:hypothetical protein